MATSNRLTEVLTEQLAVSRELQQVLQEEQKAIASLDTTLMDALNSQKEVLISNQRRVADTMRNVMSETAGPLGLPPSSSLTEIIAKLPTAMRTQLEPLQLEAKRVGSVVSVLANQNRGMLERFLDVVNDSLGFILRILNTSNTYGVRGAYLSNVQNGAVMINKEA